MIHKITDDGAFLQTSCERGSVDFKKVTGHYEQVCAGSLLCEQCNRLFKLELKILKNEYIICSGLPAKTPEPTDFQKEVERAFSYKPREK
jgi:hypothetical protein